MCAEERYDVWHHHLCVTAAYLVDDIFPDANLENSAVSYLVEQLFGDVGDHVFVRVDEGDDTVDGVVVDGRLERDAFPDLRIRAADFAERRAVGYHGGDFHKTVASGESEVVAVLNHVDDDGFVRRVTEDEREDVVVGADEIMSVSLESDMRLLCRLLSLHRDDVDGAFREITVTVADDERRRSDVPRLDIMGYIDNGSVGKRRQNGAFHCRDVIVGLSPIACKSYDCHCFAVF